MRCESHNVLVCTVLLSEIFFPTQKSKGTSWPILFISNSRENSEVSCMRRFARVSGWNYFVADFSEITRTEFDNRPVSLLGTIALIRRNTRWHFDAPFSVKKPSKGVFRMYKCILNLTKSRDGEVEIKLRLQLTLKI